MFYIAYPLLFLLSLLPLPVLYLISDGIYVLLYHVIGYRKKVTMNNLLLAFPEKSEKERLKIAKDFYLNFIDNFIETLKLISASRKFINKHWRLDNPEAYEQFYDQGRRCQIHLGHFFNWEMANIAMPMKTRYQFIIVYMPIANKGFERLFKKLRSKTGTILLPATDMRKSMVPYRNSQYMLALVADQAPGNPENAYWLPFFGQPTPFVRGPERGARVGNIPVVFPFLYKPKRGYYRCKLEVASADPANLEEGELTRNYVEFLERNMSMHPSIWLWSHRRWKHTWKNEYEKLWIGRQPAPVETEQKTTS